MGDWNITIQGTGVHHNFSYDLPADADKMFAAFVEELKAAGHNVYDATFTSGGRLVYREDYRKE